MNTTPFVLTAAVRLPIGAIRSEPASWRMFRDVLREVAAGPAAAHRPVAAGTGAAGTTSQATGRPGRRGIVTGEGVEPGLGGRVAQAVVAETGADMSRFPTEGHLISWAGLCPRKDESAVQRRSTRMRTGAPWLKTTLSQCAWAAARTKGSYLQAQFHRLRARRSAKKAIGAVAASILTAAYHMLKNGTCYQDLGPNHFDERTRTRNIQRLIHRLQNFGFDVHVTPKAA